MEKSVLQQAIERIERKLNGYWDGVNSYGEGVMSGLQISKSILESLLPAERAMLEKAMEDSWDAGIKRRNDVMHKGDQYAKVPDKQTFIETYLK